MAVTEIRALMIEATEPGAAAALYTDALGLGEHVRLRASDAPSTGFRGCTLSLISSQPSAVDALVAAATDAGASVVAPVAKSLWGYGGAVQAPDGTVITFASSSKKDSGTPSRPFDRVVLQLGVDDVRASKAFYVDRGVPVAKSYGRKYVELATAPIGLSLLQRSALAKTVGLPAEGSGSHRIAIIGDAGAFADPDGFVWEG